MDGLNKVLEENFRQLVQENGLEREVLSVDAGANFEVFDRTLRVGVCCRFRAADPAGVR